MKTTTPVILDAIAARERNASDAMTYRSLRGAAYSAARGPQSLKKSLAVIGVTEIPNEGRGDDQYAPA
jgi:hypothetical protein